MLTQTLLETAIDVHGLASVLDALATIANAKAEHIREAWQDESLAAQWDLCGAVLERAANGLPVRSISPPLSQALTVPE